MSFIRAIFLSACVLVAGLCSCDDPAVTGTDTVVVFDPCRPLRSGCPCSLPKDSEKCCIEEHRGLVCQGGYWTSFEGCPCRRDISVSCADKFVYCPGAPY